jgi:hypothetical protein
LFEVVLDNKKPAAVSQGGLVNDSAVTPLAIALFGSLCDDVKLIRGPTGSKNR